MEVFPVPREEGDRVLFSTTVSVSVVRTPYVDPSDIRSVCSDTGVPSQRQGSKGDRSQGPVSNKGLCRPGTRVVRSPGTYLR